MTLHFYLLVLLAPAALAAQGVVAGRVLDALTGAGVSNAEVYLGSSAQGLAQQSKTLSGPSGEFRLEAVLATDQYSFTVTKRTYLKASHPSRYQPTPFTIESTELTGVTIQLMPQSVLSGVIVSEDGEPLERITVLANVAQSRNGQAILRSTDSSAQTDDLGRFRLYGLAAGDFVLTANTKELPGVFSVKAGEHRSGLRLVLSYPKTFSVQGRLTQPTVGYVFVRTIPFLNGGEVKKDGSFSIDRLTPGTYTLIADEHSPEATIRLDRLVLSRQAQTSWPTVQALVDVTRMLAVAGKPFQVRVASEMSFDQVNGQPLVVIGMFSNPWTIELTRHLRFSFEGVADSHFLVKDAQRPQEVRHVYGLYPLTAMPLDYALVTRLVDPHLNRRVIAIGGISGLGTRVAADFATNERSWEQVAQVAPAGWEKGNVQVLLETRIVGDTPSPPTITAVHAW